MSTTAGATSTPEICDEPIGLASGEMPDTFLSASSSSSDDNGPDSGRLDGPNAWKPNESDDDPFFEVYMNDGFYM